MRRGDEYDRGKVGCQDCPWYGECPADRVQDVAYAHGAFTGHRPMWVTPTTSPFPAVRYSGEWPPQPEPKRPWWRRLVVEVRWQRP